MWEGLIAGVAVAAGNGLAAWWLIQWSMGRSHQTFIAAVLGGMAVRLALVGAVSLALLKLTAIHRGAYVGSLIGAFVLFQILEIALLVRRAKQQPPQGDKC